MLFYGQFDFDMLQYLKGLIVFHGRGFIVKCIMKNKSYDVEFIK